MVTKGLDNIFKAKVQSRTYVGCIFQVTEPVATDLGMLVYDLTKCHAKRLCCYCQCHVVQFLNNLKL